jgi:hypothetical protein
MVNASNLKSGDRFRLKSTTVDFTYILHQLPTNNWVLIREIDGRFWGNPRFLNKNPISAFMGSESTFTLIQ